MTCSGRILEEEKVAETENNISGTSITSNTDIATAQDTQPEDIISNPCDYVIADEYNLSDDADDTDTCPTETCRRDKKVHILYPLTGSLKCTELGCKYRTSQESWSGRKGGLLKHLEQQHDLPGLSVEKWCMMCQNTITHLYHIKKHECLKDCPTTNIIDEDLPFKCSKCTFQADTPGALRKHLRKHIADEAEARNSTVTTAIPPSPPQPSSPSTSEEHENSLDISLPSDNGEVMAAGIVDDTAGIEPDNISRSQPGVTNMNLRDPTDVPASEKFVDRLKDMYKYYSDNKWEEFESLVDEITKDAQKFVKLDKFTAAGTKKKEIEPHDPIAMQRLYRRNRRRTMRVLQGEQNTSCPIAHNLIKDKYYTQRSPSADFTVFDGAKRAERPVPMGQFSRGEVQRKLNKCENTAAGPDRLTYNHWKSYDDEARALTLIYNVCLKACKIPTAWKSSTTIMIPKTPETGVLSPYLPLSTSSSPAS